jgi:hypothetical protein
MDRKIPCDFVIKCDRCEKYFKKMYELNNHKRRKNLCKVPSEIETRRNLELKLAIEQEKNIRLDKEFANKISLEKEKINNKIILDKEKINNKIYLEKEKTRDKMTIKENEIAMRKKEIAAKLEIAKLTANERTLLVDKQKEAKLELLEARAKKEPLKKAPVQNININNGIINNTTNIFINKIEKEYMPFNDLCMSESFDKAVATFNNLLANNEISEFHEKRAFCEILTDNRNFEQIFKAVIKKSFNKPRERCFFYGKLVDEFVGIQHKDDAKHAQLVDYRIDIQPLVDEMFKKYVKKLVEHGPKDNGMYYSDDIIVIQRLNNIKNYNKDKKEIRQYVADVFAV